MRKKLEEGVNADAIDKIYASKRPRARAFITVAVVIAVIVLNLAITVICDRAMIFADISQVKYNTGVPNLYTLSDTCKDMIGGEAVPMIEGFNRESEKDEKLKIVFCADRDLVENDSKTRYVSYTARAIAKEFPDMVEVEYINIDQNPSAVQKYKTTSAATINNSDVIVAFGSEYLVQGINSFYLTDTDTGETWAYNGEKRMTAMILAVTRAEAPICCITYNHGEKLFEDSDEPRVKDEYTTFIKLIKGAGYIPQFIDLEKDEIPEDCRMMITFAPEEDFRAFGNLGESGVSEIEKLDKYLDNANAFFYICDGDSPVLANIEEYLAEWGVTVSREKDLAGNKYNFVVHDVANGIADDGGKTFSGNYSLGGTGASLTKDMRNRVYPPRVVFGNCAVIEPTAETYAKLYAKADEKNGTPEYEYYSYFRNGVSREMFSVFTSYDTASAYAGDAVEIATSVKLFNLMTVTHEFRAVQEDNYTTIDRPSYVLALASTDFLTNEVLDSAAYGNTDVVLSALRNTGNEIIPVNIPLKAFYEYNIDNNAYMQNAPVIWFWCLTLIPLLCTAVVGTVIMIRRKYK